MTKSKKNLIDYIHANKGGIVFCLVILLTQVGFAKTQKLLAHVLKTKGIADRLLHSSPDFASEYGFKKNGDARKLFDAGVELI